MSGPTRRDRIRLAAARMASKVRPEAAEPLISITIATFNRGELLVNRTLPPILNQTYRNFELIIVGDACTDSTEALVRSVGDPRIRLENLTSRGVYPENPLHRWMVAGAVPLNRAIAMSRGSWLAYCDDDDCWTLDHLEVLLATARQTEAELVYGAGRFQRSPDEWLRIGAEPPIPGNVMHSAVLYRGYLRFLEYDIEAWRETIGADAQLWRRMRELGVRFQFLDRIVCEAPLRPGETLAGQRARIEQEKEWAGGRRP